MKTAEVAAASGYSVQQIRLLEDRGVIPPATRLGNGYRCFSSVHCSALEIYRHLAIAAGPVSARAVMKAAWRQPVEATAMVLTGLGHRIQEERQQVVAARSALESIRSEAVSAAESESSESMTISELSTALGVRASTLRFWESEGLVSPDRVHAGASTARIYRRSAIRDARITSALRTGGYRIPEVRTILSSLRELGDVSRSLDALEERQKTVAGRAVALFQAGGALVDLIDGDAST